jgi:hypothetical protein
MDGPERLLLAAAAMLPADRADWGQAMAAELAHVSGRSQRWRFALGCGRASVLVPVHEPAGRPLVVAVSTAAAAAAGLVVVALVRYPGLIVGSRTWIELAVFAGVLAAYPAATAVVVRSTSRAPASAALPGAIAVAPVAALWMAIGVTAAARTPQYFGVGLVVAIVVLPLSVGACGAWRGRGAPAGRRSAALCALGAGLLVFLAWVAEAVFDDGRPYDAGLLRDFSTSGARDLATYALSDNLGAAMGLLVLVPFLAFGFGAIGAGVTGRLMPHR